MHKCNDNKGDLLSERMNRSVEDTHNISMSSYGSIGSRQLNSMQQQRRKKYLAVVEF